MKPTSASGKSRRPRQGFWNASTGFDQTDPLIGTFSAKSDFFRCKQCHGWDQPGSAGFYIKSTGQLGTVMGPTPLALAEMKSLYRYLADPLVMPR